MAVDSIILTKTHFCRATVWTRRLQSRGEAAEGEKGVKIPSRVNVKENDVKRLSSSHNK